MWTVNQREKTALTIATAFPKVYASGETKP
jgi:hypothetical protein